MKFLKFTLKIALFCAFAFALFLILDALYPLNLDMLNKQKSRILYDRNGEILNMQISDDQIWRFYASADEIPPRLKQSAIYFEDRYFYYHFGVNPASILRAATYNFTQNFTKKSEGNVERVGASTITMQVARMMRPKQRSYKNKIIEIFNAFQLEWHFSKDEILGMYFNLAPYGGNIEGVKTAAYFYFKKDLRELSSAQIALLSVIPKNPNKNRLDRRSSINALKNRLISQLREGGVISQSEYERALAEPFSPRRYAAPNYAPHYALLAFSNYKMQNFTAKDDVNFTQNLEQVGAPGATTGQASSSTRRTAAGAESNFSDAASAESSFTALTRATPNLSGSVSAQARVDSKEMNSKEADFKTDAPESLNLGGRTSLNLNERESAKSQAGVKPNEAESVKPNERKSANLDERRDLINVAHPSQNSQNQQSLNLNEQRGAAHLPQNFSADTEGQTEYLPQNPSADINLNKRQNVVGTAHPHQNSQNPQNLNLNSRQDTTHPPQNPQADASSSERSSVNFSAQINSASDVSMQTDFASSNANAQTDSTSDAKMQTDSAASAESQANSASDTMAQTNSVSGAKAQINSYPNAKTQENSANSKASAQPKEQTARAQELARLNEGKIYSSLDLKTQIALEGFLKSEILSLRDKGVRNGAAVLIDNESMRVIAYVGSHDFSANEGQNDGVRSQKNVGSTLKPFIYAKALEHGLITPSKKLIDAPITFAGYVPRNYNQGFLGAISATDALSLSLNIPAVKLNLMLGDDGLYEMLSNVHLAEFSKDYYGAGIALGSISMSLMDLARLYSAFANGGKLRKLEIASVKIGDDAQIMSPQGAYIVTQMLRNAPRSYLGSVWQNTLNTPPLMFKTGTSADARDLYTVALTPKFTLGVWLGNFDGSKTRDLSGGVSAAKVAFNMFAFLDKSGMLGEVEFARPAGVSLRRVCTDAYREKECAQSADDLTIDGVEPNEECEIYGTSELFYLLKHGLVDPQKVRAGRCAAKFAAVKPVLNDINAKTYETGADGFLRLKVQCTAVFGERVYIRLSGGSREFIVLNSTAFTRENSADLDFEHSSAAQQDNLKQNLAQQNFAEQNSTAQNSMRQNLAPQNLKSQNLTKQNSAGLNFIAENPVTRNLASQNSILQNSTEQNSEVQNFTDQNFSQQNSAARDFTTQSLAPANSKVKMGEYFARTNGEAFTLSLGAGDFELGCLDENANFAKANFRVNERK
ncbi:transglycosylase domain-containing protein [uncultured Campylobacter sp.]|uniref:transglycosylase domain-containing protein n=1 Tax=uncultured Campylobacter sp. TaxID=218934 RepID=UPI0026106BAF|nr:transglycosylase domain-containing protein [uncultured Campylobacter sp.]